MVWFRVAVGSRGYCHLGDDCSHCLSNTNGITQGQRWGASLQLAHDGFDVLTQATIQRRNNYARAYDSNVLSLAYAPPLPPAEAISSHAPASWMQQQRFGAATSVAPTFEAAWAIGSRIGDGFSEVR